MAKRKDTIELENALIEMCTQKRIYGCEEVSIGFHNAGKCDEIVDFISMDSKGIIKCYEIKVTLPDLMSDAKKSWYGHYNYLVVSDELYQSIEKWENDIPGHIGIISGRFLRTVKNAKKQNIDIETSVMLKESMIRSMFYKIQKYKDANNLENHKNLKKQLAKTEKEKKEYQSRLSEINYVVQKFEKFYSLNNEKTVCIEELATEEREKFLETKNKK